MNNILPLSWLNEQGQANFLQNGHEHDFDRMWRNFDHLQLTASSKYAYYSSRLRDQWRGSEK